VYQDLKLELLESNVLVLSTCVKTYPVYFIGFGQILSISNDRLEIVFLSFTSKWENPFLPSNHAGWQISEI